MMARILPFAATLLALVVPAASSHAKSAPIAQIPITLHAGDFVIGPALEKLPDLPLRNSPYHWHPAFDLEHGGQFDVALRKAASPIPAPPCRTDYVLLTMGDYRPWHPYPPPLDEVKAIYDQLLKIQETGTGTFTGYVTTSMFHAVRYGRHGPELTSCELHFVAKFNWGAAKRDSGQKPDATDSGTSGAK